MIDVYMNLPTYNSIIISLVVYLSKMVVYCLALQDMEYIYPMRNTTTTVPNTDEIIPTSSQSSPL